MLPTRQNTSGQHVLVTGATGFLGRAVVAATLNMNHKVSALVRSPHPAGVLPPTVLAHPVDQDDSDAIAALLKRERPDILIDCAGKVPPATEAQFRHDNLSRIETLISALQAAPVLKRVVAVGSSAQYGLATPQTRATRETDPWRPAGPYGESKVAGMQAWLAAAKGGVPVTLGILFNVMGPLQPEDNVPACFVQRLHQMTEDTIDIGPISVVRDFLDMRDCADALLTLAQHGRSGEIYNIGSGIPTRIEEVLHTLRRVSGISFGWKASPLLDKPGSVPVSYANIDKLSEETGWHPSQTFEASLQTMWNSLAMNKADIRQITEKAETT